MKIWKERSARTCRSLFPFWSFIILDWMQWRHTVGQKIRHGKRNIILIFRNFFVDFFNEISLKNRLNKGKRMRHIEMGGASCEYNAKTLLTTSKW